MPNDFFLDHVYTLAALAATHASFVAVADAAKTNDAPTTSTRKPTGLPPANDDARPSPKTPSTQTARSWRSTLISVREHSLALTRERELDRAPRVNTRARALACGRLPTDGMAGAVAPVRARVRALGVTPAVAGAMCSAARWSSCRRPAVRSQLPTTAQASTEAPRAGGMPRSMIEHRGL